MICSRYIRASTLSTLVLITVLICCGGEKSSHAAQSYQPVFADAAGTGPQGERGTLKGDFSWALHATTLDDAASRLKQFLKTHTPANGELEDGFQKNHLDAAKYELMRVYYLQGDAKSGDKLLRELNPLGL